MDRYVYSNIAYQCAKIDDTEEEINLKIGFLTCLQYTLSTKLLNLITRFF